MRKHSGKGTINYQKGDVYEGEFRDAEPHGQGKMTYTDGRICEGEWKNGRLQKGTCKWKNGRAYVLEYTGHIVYQKYEGELVGGEPHGKGKMTYSDGDVYEGDWKDGKCHGKGTRKWSDGEVYEGDWKDDMSDGKGTYKWPNGGMYEGEFKDGMRHGKGTCKFEDEDVYKGEWIADNMHGKGVMNYANKDVYDGEWIDREMNGQGVMKYHNGDVYSGEWRGGVKHGKGTFEYTNGDVLKSTGEWKDGKKYGVFEDVVRVSKQVIYENDEQLNGLISTHTRPSGEYYEDWTVATHVFKMPRGEGGQIRRNWVSRTSNAGNTLFKKMYCPQVGDSVVYIPRAHYDTMQKFPIASYVGDPHQVSFPYEVHQRSQRKDEKLDGVAAILTLDIIGVPAARSADRNYPWPSPNFVAPIATASTLEVTLFESDQTEFIIPEFLYSWRIRALEDAIDANDGNVDGIRVTLRCAPDPGENERAAEDPNYVFYHGRLKDVLWMDEREFHFECSGHNSLSMNWELEDGGQEEEVFHVCSWDIAINNAEPPEVPTMSKEMKKELLSALNEVLRMDEKVREWFYLQVDTSQYTDYFDMIEVPMYISLIQSRLQNNYYTNKYSVLSDVELIKENCYKYNEANNEFYDLACQVYDKFKALVDAIDTPDNDEVKTNVKRESTSDVETDTEDAPPNKRQKVGRVSLSP